MELGPASRFNAGKPVRRSTKAMPAELFAAIPHIKFGSNFRPSDLRALQMPAAAYAGCTLYGEELLGV